MNDRETAKRLEEAKFRYRDEAIIVREREAAVAAMNMSTFVTAIGPMGIFLMKAVKALPVGAGLAYFIYATVPLGLALTLINFFKTPKDYRGSKLILRAVLLSVAMAVTTFVLAGYWGLMKTTVDVEPDVSP
jgi:hypothetical protein